MPPPNSDRASRKAWKIEPRAASALNGRRVDLPEGLVAGELQHYATTLTLGGFARGFLGIAVDGRPIKIEGNGRHPAGLGATDIFTEAEVLSLYDPDRTKTVRHADQISTWDDFRAAAGVLVHPSSFILHSWLPPPPSPLLRRCWHP